MPTFGELTGQQDQKDRPITFGEYSAKLGRPIPEDIRPPETPQQLGLGNAQRKQMVAEQPPQETGLGKRFINTLPALGNLVMDLPTQAKGYIANIAEGSRPLDETTKMDQWAKAANDLTNQRMTAPDANDETLLGTKADWANTAASIPFSLGSMGGSALVGLGAGAATLNPVVGFGAQAATAGALAHRADSAMFMRQGLNAFEQDYAAKNNGVLPSREEMLAEQERLQPFAFQHGLAEALPEAIGTPIALGVLGKAITGGGNVAVRAGKAALGMAGTELPTETVTQQFQHNIESEAGTSDQPQRSMTSGEDWAKSFKEVAVPVIQQGLLTGLVGGIAGNINDKIAKKQETAPPSLAGAAELVTPEANEQIVAQQVADMNARHGTPGLGEIAAQATNESTTTTEPAFDPQQELQRKLDRIRQQELDAAAAATRENQANTGTNAAGESPTVEPIVTPGTSGPSTLSETTNGSQETTNAGQNAGRQGQETLLETPPGEQSSGLDPEAKRLIKKYAVQSGEDRVKQQSIFAEENNQIDSLLANPIISPGEQKRLSERRLKNEAELNDLSTYEKLLADSEPTGTGEAVPAQPEEPGTDNNTGEPQIETAGETPVVDEAAPVVQEPIEQPTESTFENLKIHNLPVKDLKLSEDVPQFKSDANKQGVVEPLGGKFDPQGVAPIQVWERLDGSKEIISGRHRWDLAKRSNTETIPAQIHREADGFTAEKAAVMDAELNIRDGQAKAKDYVNYFTASGLSEEEASQRGLLARKLGKSAFTISQNGSDTLITAHRNDALTDEEAAKIATAAPKNEAVQAVGLQAINDGKKADYATNLMAAVQLKQTPEQAKSENTDLFGFDDSQMQEAKAMADQATIKQNELKKQRAAAKIGLKAEAAQASTGGQVKVEIKDKKQLEAYTKDLDQKIAAWNNWPTNPELVKELTTKPAEAPATDKENLSVDSTAPSLLSSYTNDDLAQREKQAAEQAKLEAKTAATAKSRAAADKEVDTLADEMLGNIGTQDLFGGSPLGEPGQAYAPTKQQLSPKLTNSTAKVTETENPFLEQPRTYESRAKAITALASSKTDLDVTSATHEVIDNTIVKRPEVIIPDVRNLKDVSTKTEGKKTYLIDNTTQKPVITTDTGPVAFANERQATNFLIATQAKQEDAWKQSQTAPETSLLTTESQTQGKTSPLTAPSAIKLGSAQEEKAALVTMAAPSSRSEANREATETGALPANSESELNKTPVSLPEHLEWPKQINERQAAYLSEPTAKEQGHEAPANNKGWINLPLQPPVHGESTIGKIRIPEHAIDTPEKALNVIAPIRKTSQEHLAFMVLDQDNKPIKVIQHSVGTKSSAVTDIGSLVGQVINTPNAASVWMAHNHPSGTTTQSDADLNVSNNLTDLLNGTGIKNNGSLVTSYGGVQGSVYVPGGQQQNITTQGSLKKGEVPLVERTVTRGSKLGGQTITGPETAKMVAKGIAQKRSGIMLMDAQNQPLNFIEMSPEEMGQLRGKGANTLFKKLHENNADTMIAIVNGVKRSQNEHMDAAANLNTWATKSNITMLDMLVDGGSIRETLGRELPVRRNDTFYSRTNTKDKAYMDAVNTGDMETAQQLINEHAERQGYGKTDYQMQHTAPDRTSGTNIQKLNEIYPEDIYSGDATRYYGDGNRHDAEAVQKLQAIRNKKPTASVWVYRAVPKGTKETAPRNGDWVSTTRGYAEQHGRSNLPEGYKVIAFKAQAQHLFTDGNSVHELGYDDGKNYNYANTKNNRKLHDVVTRDDAGEVIPLSKRFNKRSDDKRYARSSGQAASRLTPDQVRELLPPVAKDMEKNGNLVILPNKQATPNEAMAQEDRENQNWSVQGMYHQSTDKIYLYADQLTSRNALYHLAHELFHRAELTDAFVQKMVARMDEFFYNRFALAKNGQGTAIERKAYQALMEAETPVEQQLQEFRAYLVQKYLEQPRSITGEIKKAIENFIAAIRMTLARLGLDAGYIKTLSPADLLQLSKYGSQSTGKAEAMAALASKSDAVVERIMKQYGAQSREEIAAAVKQYRTVETKFFNKDGSEKDGAMRAPNGNRSNLNKVQWLQVQTPNFKRWFGFSQALDENGEPQLVYHGAYADFTRFNPNKAQVMGDMGAGFYFTNNSADVKENYAGQGADLESRIEMLAENIQDQYAEDGEDISYEDAKAEARAELMENQGVTMPAFLRMANPVILSGENETFFDYSDNYDEETDDYGEPTGAIVDLAQAIQDLDESVFDVSKDEAIAMLYEKAQDWGGLKASEVIETLKDAFQNAEMSETGDMAGNEITRELMMQIGHDGFIDPTVNRKFGSQRKFGKSMPGMDEYTTHYIVNGPEQIKSATGNAGTFDPNNPDIRFSQHERLYSALKRAFLTSVPDKIFQINKAKGIKQWLASNTNKLGIKPDEIYWTGLNDYLDSLGDNRVSRDEIVKYLTDNAVKVQDIVLNPGGENAEMDNFIDDHNGRVTFNYGVWGVEWDQVEISAGFNNRISAENYLWQHAETLMDAEGFTSNYSKYDKSDYVLSGGVNHKEIVTTIPGIERWGQSDETHYGDVGKGRQIAWTRQADYTATDDTEGTLINEFQSKRMMEGRTKGFKVLDRADIKIQELTSQIAKLNADVSWTEKTDEEIDGLNKQIAELEAQREALYGQRTNVSISNRLKVPPAPFITTANNKASEAYLTLLWKKAILNAIDNGKGFIAWTTGDQQANFYDLSKKISMASAIANKDGTYNLVVEDITGQELRDYGGSGKKVTPAEMEDTVGKDVAKKLIEGADRVKDIEWKNQKTNPAFYTVRGDDLKIESPWTARMYGDENGLDRNGKPSMITQIAQDIAKKYGGEIGQVSINASAYNIIDIGVTSKPWSVMRGDDLIDSFKTEEEAKNYVSNTKNGLVQKQPALIITPAMVEKVLGEGFPLFSKIRDDKLAAIEKMTVGPRKDGGLSTRVIFGAKSLEDHMRDYLQSGIDAAKASVEAWKRNAEHIAKYPVYRPEASNTPDEIIERFMGTMTSNLRWLYNLEPKEVRDRSKLWYDGAYRITSRFADRFGYSKEQVAGVIATQSPQTEWFTNVSKAERIIAIYKNQQNFKWDAAMTKTALKIFGERKFLERLRRVKNSTLSALQDPMDIAMWIRAYDESHNNRKLREISPEGYFLDFVKNNSGQLAYIAWGSLPELAKGVSILQNGNIGNISNQLGDSHKVRNFYNNIIAPNSTEGDITIDTHAGAAADLTPYSANDVPVIQYFTTGSNSKETGSMGTYGVRAEAYRIVAKEFGILPRELQSITWEAVRVLFSEDYKKLTTPALDENGEPLRDSKGKIIQRYLNKEAIENIWLQYRDGKLSLEQARDQIYEHATRGKGIARPAWWGRPTGELDETTPDSSYSRELSGYGIPGRTTGAVGRGAGSDATERATGKKELTVGITAATDTITRLANLNKKVMAGDMTAAGQIQELTRKELTKMMAHIVSAEVISEPGIGLYDGYTEATTAVTVRYKDADYTAIMQALFAFSEKYNQEQFHVRAPIEPNTDVGYTGYNDGSFNTIGYRFAIKKPMTKAEIEELIAKANVGISDEQQKLAGLTATDKYLETYYAGEPDNATATTNFINSAKRLHKLLGKSTRGNDAVLQRLWVYGKGAIPYQRVDSGIQTYQAEASQVEQPNVLYSRKRNDYTPEAEQALDKMLADRTLGKLTPRQRLDKTTNLLATKINQGVFDKYRSFRDILQDPTAWMMARMQHSAGEAVAAAITEGQLRLDPSGALYGDATKTSFLKAIQPLAGELDDALAWIAGQRAELINQKAADAVLREAQAKAEIKLWGATIQNAIRTNAPRSRIALMRRELKKREMERKEAKKAIKIQERYLTPPMIAGLKTLDAGLMKDGRKRADVYEQFRKDFEQINNSFVRIAVDTGTVSSAEADKWENEGIYVPFYRFLEDKEVRGVSTMDGLANNNAYKHYRGSAKPLDDLLTNVLGNWQHLVDTGLKNQAAAQAVKSAEALGIMTKAVPNHDGDLFVRDGGKKIWYKLNNPKSDESRLVLESLLSMSYHGLNDPIIDFAAKGSALLRFGVVVNPAFKIRNIIRDTVQAVATANVKYNMFDNLVTGWNYTTPGSPEDFLLRAAGGTFGESGYLFTGKTEDMRKAALAALKDPTIINTESKLTKLMDKTYGAYSRLGARLENVNRAAAFKKTYAETGNLLRAGFEANDTMPFQMRGTNILIYELSKLVPFFNAGLQGMDKLVRSFRTEESARRFYVSGSMYVAASVGLALAMAGDDDYDKAEQWMKESYHLFKIPGDDTLYKLPRPFELGALASMAERVAELFVADSPDPGFAAERMAAVLLGQMRLNPTPQAFKPIIELWANKSFFTGREIENQGLSHKAKSERAYASTSEVSKGIAKGLSVLGEESPISMSPVQVEHLINGYTGWLGMFTLSGIDAIARPLMDIDSPASVTKVPFFGQAAEDIRRAFSADKFPRNTRFTTEFYDNIKTLESLSSAMKSAKEANNQERIGELTKSYGPAVNYASYYRAQAKLISGLNKEIEKTYTSTLSAQAKKDRIDMLNQKRNQIAERATKTHKVARNDH